MHQRLARVKRGSNGTHSCNNRAVVDPFCTRWRPVVPYVLQAVALVAHSKMDIFATTVHNSGTCCRSDGCITGSMGSTLLNPLWSNYVGAKLGQLLKLVATSKTATGNNGQQGRKNELAMVATPNFNEFATGTCCKLEKLLIHCRWMLFWWWNISDLLHQRGSKWSYSAQCCRMESSMVCGNVEHDSIDGIHPPQLWAILMQTLHFLKMLP